MMMMSNTQNLFIVTVIHNVVRSSRTTVTVLYESSHYNINKLRSFSEMNSEK